MYDQNNMPARTRMSHYLRTGQKIDGFQPDSYKSSKGLSREKITLIINKGLREPDRTLVYHYFFSRGQTFDLVNRGLLPFITGARVFQKTRDRFLGQIQRDLLREAKKLCGLSQEDYNYGPGKIYQEISEEIF